MLARRVIGSSVPPIAATPLNPQKLWPPLARALAFALGRLFGTADGHTVAAMAARELGLIIRSRDWFRFTGMWLGLAVVAVAAPMLYRCELGQWREPGNAFWFLISGYGLQLCFVGAMAQWSIRHLRRDLSTSRLDELLLTRCSAADIAMAEALASAFASLWLVAATFPICLFLAAMVGQGFATALRLALSLAPAGALGVWFGLGWGLAFAVRRTSGAGALTDWWIRSPLIPIWAVWCFLGAFPVIWAVLGLIPGGLAVMKAAAYGLGWVALQLLYHWNPALTVAGAAGLAPTTWFTDWLVLVLFFAFMMRKSVDGVQLALGHLGERDVEKADTVYWLHHDGQFFTQFGGGAPRAPQYRDGGNPITAFDVAFGHRVYLHPFLWTIGLLAYLFLVGWSLLVPDHGRFTAIAAVLVPATGALLLMSGGVAVSFGWERDQQRWSELAVLPIGNVRLALGKIKGAVRPTLWIGLLASLTAVLLGWRGALDWHASLWFALHVLLFPVVLAFVSATLALTTPTVGEALYRWAVLGAIPTLATALPPPLGGGEGFAAPFSPPVMVLFLVLDEPSAALIRGAWISLGLEAASLLGGLAVLALFLRRWTLDE